MTSKDGFLETILVDIWNTTDNIIANTNLLKILSAINIGLLLILSTVIIINQIRIRKQLRQIQEQLDQKDKPE